ncbi:MAG: hypothetical protein MJ246_08790 [Clostridia bacterium]|nr:hypothetical protein [Clostridia bacterium]
MNPLANMLNMNPKQIAQGLIKKIGTSNPVVNELSRLADNGDTKGIENLARDYFKKQGMDFDEEYKKFMSNIKM